MKTWVVVDTDVEEVLSLDETGRLTTLPMSYTKAALGFADKESATRFALYVKVRISPAGPTFEAREVTA